MPVQPHTTPTPFVPAGENAAALASNTSPRRVERTGESNRAHEIGAGMSVVEQLRGHARLLAPKEAAQILKVHPETIYLLMKKGSLPSIRVGRARRIDSVLLANWLSERSCC